MLEPSTCQDFIPQNTHNLFRDSLISLILIIFMTIVAFKYLRDIWQYSDLNPIQQLSPLLTITQGISLYIFSLDTIIILWSYSSELIQPKEGNKTFLLIDSFIFIFSRGFFYVVSVMKSYRIILALRKNKLKRKCLRVKIFSNEKLILLISIIITIVFWSGVSYIKAKYQGNIFLILLIFEQENLYNMIINGIEEATILILIAFIIKSHYSDKLLNLTFSPLYIYVIWFTMGAFFVCDDEKVQETDKGKISLIIFLMWCSYILRTWVMFYMCIIRPLNQKVYIQSPFIPLDVILQFRYFIKQKFCNQIFYQYLNFLDQGNDIPISEDNLTQKYTLIQIFEIWVELKIKKDLIQKDGLPLTNHHHISQNEQKLFEILNDVFQNKFLLTKSANSVLQLYQHNESLNYNFYTLNLQTTFIMDCNQEID